MSRCHAIVVLSFLWGFAPLASGQENLTKEEHAQLVQQAEKYRQAGEYAKALPLYERVAKATPGLYGEESGDHAAILNNFAVLYQAMRQYAKAEPLFQRSLKIYEARRGPNDPDVSTELHNLAGLYKDMGQYTKAESLYQRSLRIDEATLGVLEVAGSLDSLGELYRVMDQYAKAEPIYQRSLKIREGKLGSGHLDVAASLENLGSLYVDMNQYAKAEPLYRRGLKIRETQQGPEHVGVATALIGLAELYRAMGEYVKAEPLYERSLKIYEAGLGPDHSFVATSLNNLALLRQAMGEHAKAEPLFQRSLQIREDQLGREHVDVAASLNNLAMLYHDMGEYAKAEPLSQRGLRIWEAKLGPDQRLVATGLSNLALIYMAMGQYERAEPLFQRSVKINEAKLGPEHLDVAVSLNNLATLYDDARRYAEAQPLYERSLKIREAKLGPEHPAVAVTLNNLALVHVAMGRYAKAEPLFERAERINEAKLGPDHPLVATNLNNLANLYRATGQYVKAEPLFGRSLRIREAKLGPHHPDVAATLERLVYLHVALERWEEAARNADRMRRVVRRHVARVLPALAENEQRKFLENEDVSAFHTVQTLGLMRSADAALTELSAAWVVNGKGVAQQALAERALLARDSRDPATASLARALTGVRVELAALSLGQFKPEEAANRQARIAALNKQEEEASRKLGQAAGRPTRDDPWIELNEVRQALAPDAVLVEISRFNVMDFKEYQWRLPHYAAWIVPPAGKGAVRLVDLGEAGPIDDAVNGVLRALREAPRRIPQQGEAESEKALQRPLQGLAKLLLEPLMPHIADAKRWIIGPDAQLWLVPWAALPLKDGRYAIEQYSIGYVVSGRDLVTGATKGVTDRPLILADPDFDLSPSAVASETHEALRGAAIAPVAALAGHRLGGTIGKWNVSFAFGDEGRLTIHDENAGGRVAGEGRWALEGATLNMQTAFARYLGVVQSDVVVGERTASGKSDNWQFRLPAGAVATRGLAAELRSSSLGGLLSKVPRLPGTAAEAEAITPSVKACAKAEPRVYTDKQALEGVFKATHSPRLVVLSTHGFFLPEQEVKRDERFDRGFGQEVGGNKVALGADGKALENPLLRCGLLLAGCNQRDKTGRADGDDGVLTGLEIVGTDLRGTELVVLSACETALGEVRDGEGVAGLRQAFQLAGAQSVVATLWQIPDRDSALLMTDFFGQLASGRGKVEALREAQLARIKARRARNEAAHPFFWAAFTLTGQDGSSR